MSRRCSFIARTGASSARAAVTMVGEDGLVLGKLGSLCFVVHNQALGGKEEGREGIKRRNRFKIGELGVKVKWARKASVSESEGVQSLRSAGRPKDAAAKCYACDI